MRRQLFQEGRYMNYDLINENDFKECADFHGHICPGLAIGYRAAKAGLAKLAESRAKDEELVAIVETDACGVDAIQVLSGCTFGKGNFIYRDYGKHAFTFFSRKTGKGVRAALKPGAIPHSDKQKEISDKIKEGKATDDEIKFLSEMRLDKTVSILDMPEDDLFDFIDVQEKMPDKARLSPSVPCDKCRELTMVEKTEKVGGMTLCRGCVKMV